jgi:PAS domain S-box-containing protein
LSQDPGSTTNAQPTSCATPTYAGGYSLQLIYDTAPIGLAFLSPDCRYLQINKRLTEICGISVEEHLGRSVRECVPALADSVEAIVRSVIETGEPVTGIEVASQRSDETEARSWITYWHPMFDSNHEIVGVNVAAEEITERKRAEAALRASEQQFRTLADSIPQLVWMSEADGRIFWFNSRMSEFASHFRLDPLRIKKDDRKHRCSYCHECLKRFAADDVRCSYGTRYFHVECYKRWEQKRMLRYAS